MTRLEAVSRCDSGIVSAAVLPIECWVNADDDAGAATHGRRAGPLSIGDPKLSSRLLIGAIAGFAATVAMTAAMSRLHRRLPARDRYPLPPREIVESTARQAGVELADEAAMDVTTAAHFGYGALTGSLIGAASPRIGPGTGAMAGVAVWVASYLGWIPVVGILKPATVHPRRRNALMLGAHLVWGGTTALAMRELMLARETMLRSARSEARSGKRRAPGENPDAPRAGRVRRKPS